MSSFTDVEAGKQKKFLAAADSPAEREYVARYGQKQGAFAYETAVADKLASVPQPLTPGHVTALTIKAITDAEAAADSSKGNLGAGGEATPWHAVSSVLAKQQCTFQLTDQGFIEDVLCI